MRTILHSKFKGTKWTEIGLENESAAVKEYLELKTELNEKLKFEKMGLVISKKCPFWNSLPDEIKRAESLNTFHNRCITWLIK